MDSDEELTAAVARRITDETAHEPLAALRLATRLQTEIDGLLVEAVRAAAAQHSWTDIGAALNVSKQAAHHKYVRSMADALRDETRTEKAQKRAGQVDEARAAKSRRDALVAELKKTGRRA